MENYMNAKERDLFVLILAFDEYLKIFKESKCLSDYERRKVDLAEKHIAELNSSIKNRMGYVFLKKLKSYLDSNHLGFYAKGIVRDTVVCNIDDEVLEELLADANWNMDCVGCNKQNHTDCRCYRIFVAMGKNGNGKKDGCPFR